MAPHFPANGIPAHLLMWQRVREYAVPPSMIETATARRAVGDWAGACAAARVDVALDPRAVRVRHGTALLRRLRADLRRLAPDLLRWHMPRIAPDGRLRPGLTVSLARYERSGTEPLHLVVRTPPAQAEGGQRMTLALWDGDTREGAAALHPHPHPDRRFRLDLHRHLWDAARSGELAGRSTPDRAAEAELLLRAEGRPRGPFSVRLGARHHAVFDLVAPDDSHAPTLRSLPAPPPGTAVTELPLLPEAAARPLPDVELLRAGLVAAERLHPLVASALLSPGEVRAAAPGPEPGDPHRVECRGEIHRIALRDEVLTAVDHDPAQVLREELLMALGGPGLPCLRAIDAAHRSPEALPAVRERLLHGDVTGALTVVEGLLGRAALLRDGPLRDALTTAVTRHLDAALHRAGLTSPNPDSPRPWHTPRKKPHTRGHPRAALTR